MICSSNSALAATYRMCSKSCIVGLLKNESNIEFAEITSVIYKMVLTLNRAGGVGLD